MDYNKIPDKINNFRAYHGTAADDSVLLGVTDEVTLPDFSLKSETINLAGLAGDIDSPAEGQLEASQIAIPFSNVSKQSMSLVADDTKPIILRSAQEFIDKETGTKVYTNRTITVKGMTKGMNMGTLKKGGYGNPSITKNITYYKDVIDGETITEIDYINFKYIVNGVDRGAQISDLI